MHFFTEKYVSFSKFYFQIHGIFFSQFVRKFHLENELYWSKNDIIHRMKIHLKLGKRVKSTKQF